MTFEEACALAREIMAAGYYVATVTCDLPGRVPGVWRILFRTRAGSREQQLVSSREHWAFWQTPQGQQLLREKAGGA
jgi:hypothetical protein